MNPAELNKRISLQSKTLTSDTMGGWTETWETVATVWAKKTTHRSDEAVQAMAMTGKATHNFRVRYRTDVDSSWRILQGSIIMAIVGPPVEVTDKDTGERFLDITAREAE